MAFHPHVRAHLARKALFFLALAAGVAVIVWWRSESRAIQTEQSGAAIQAVAETKASDQPANFNKGQYSTNDPSSIWTVVNKGRILPNSYIPSDLVAPKVSLSESTAADNMHLRSDSAAALEKLIAEVTNSSLQLMLVSGYRSYTTQQSVYGSNVSSQGQAYADATSARPGHSEHQTGLAADLGTTSRKCQLETCFGDTPEGQWLADNAYKYGFIIRYQKDKKSLTGYEYEPWHLRYVGIDLAAQLNKTGQTLEQFFSLPVYTDYPASYYQLGVGL